MTTTRKTTFAKSGFLESIEWQGYADMSGNGILAVVMKNGKSYRYADVPETVFDEFSAADSAGHYYGQAVRSRFQLVPSEADA